MLAHPLTANEAAIIPTMSSFICFSMFLKSLGVLPILVNKSLAQQEHFSQQLHSIRQLRVIHVNVALRG